MIRGRDGRIAVYEMRRAGKTYRAIANEIGVTPARVQAICIHAKQDLKREYRARGHEIRCLAYQKISMTEKDAKYLCEVLEVMK